MVRISRSFIKSSLMYTLAGSLPMASAIILLPFYLLYLSTDNYGALSIYLALSVLIQILTTYSFDTGIYVFFHEYKKDKRLLGLYISSVFVFLLITGILVGIVFSISGNILFNWLLAEKDLDFFPYGLMAVGTGILQSLFKVHSNLLQTSQRPALFFWSNLLSFSMIAGFTIVGLELFPQTLLGPIGGRLIAAFLSALWVLGRIFRLYGHTFSFRILKESFPFNNPSLIYQIQQWSMNYFDRFIMVFYMDLSVIGVYDFAVKCMLALEFVISGLYNSFYPKVITLVTDQEHKQSTEQINRYYHGLVAVIMVLVCLAILSFSLIIDLGLIRSGYEESIEFLPLIGIVYLVRSSRYYFAFPYGAMKFSRPLPVIYMVVSVFKIILIISFIDDYNVYAVIGAGILSTFLEIFMLWFFIRKRFHFKFNGLKIFAAPLSLGICIAIFQSFNLLESYVAYGFYMAICFVVLFLLYRKELASISRTNLFR